MIFQNFIINKNAVANFADIILNVTVKVGGNRMSRRILYNMHEKIKKENELILLESESTGIKRNQKKLKSLELIKLIYLIASSFFY
jgi:alpha-galactosidase